MQRSVFRRVSVIPSLSIVDEPKPLADPEGVA